jgi:pyruvate/2-oxoglutarate dehydrogenase complex dihydrolipoamide dehydrogenase (E3) component
MPQSANYDVIVIGTSQGGRFLPITFAKAGRKVAVVERGHLGGVCVNAGCTPTKNVSRSERMAIKLWPTCTLLPGFTLRRVTTPSISATIVQ